VPRAGLRLQPRLASPTRISRALEQLLSDPAFRRRAAQLGAEVRQAGGVVRAADLIEAALGTDGQRLEVVRGA
jgi:zeaxanthin glucosyltransferase